MQYRTFSEPKSSYKYAILTQKLEADGIVREYLAPYNIPEADVIAYQLHITGKKTSKADQKEFLNDALDVLEDMNVEYIIVTEGEYFKTLTGAKKAEANLGYVLDIMYPQHNPYPFKVVFCPNYRQVFYDPKKARAKIRMSLTALWNHVHGVYEAPGHAILKEAHYPQTVAEISEWLTKLLQMDRPLTCDIEGFSLKHHSAGIGTIAFAWSEHEGVAFPVDLLSQGDHALAVRDLLRKFFRQFEQPIIYHNISYDAYVLIYQLFMKHLTDTAGLLNGLNVMLKNWDDTKLITYLATNSCAGNELSLKAQAQEFAGNYAVEEIKDIRKLPLDQLLEYNLIDACSTWFVYNKHWNTVVADKQTEIYFSLFQPAIKDIIQMQLTGMPLDMEQVLKTKVMLKADQSKAVQSIQKHSFIQGFTNQLKIEWADKRNAELKVKRVTALECPLKFNPNSGPQLQRLLYEELELPIIEYTKQSKAPSVSGDTLEKLKLHADSEPVLDLLNQLLAFKAVDKIISTFIPPMESALEGPDGGYYLFGNFNLGGTVSGRLSSSKPNLQNLPATGSKYAKAIKNCFRAPPGYLMIGLDFASLEDRISALTTKDKNKLKVYTDGYDGHSLRAYAYFKDHMPDIDPTCVKSINSIAKKYGQFRQDSKMPTFALTYQGTCYTLMAKGGFSEEDAKNIEQSYHDLYKESDDWIADKLNTASQTGYITAAFGLRVRTPLLHQVIRGNKATPYEASAEGRTAGNALGQSWCLLNSRASAEFMQTVRKGKYATKIRPIAHIHDAQYYIIPNDLNILAYVNEHLVKAVEWQNHPDIKHDTVKLGGNLSIFHPSWAEEIDLPNNAGPKAIQQSIADHYAKRSKSNQSS
jgi:DNA polymerase-1